MTKITDDMRCFRCGKPIRNGEFYVHTLSNENAHVYCQATGVKPNKQEKGEEMTKVIMAFSPPLVCRI